MKKSLCAILLAFVLLLSSVSGFAFAEADTTPLKIAFGLFSVQLPQGTFLTDYHSHLLSDYCFETEDTALLIQANYAPLEDYRKTAERKLRHILSLTYAAAGDHYSETEITEETLENGILLRWQMMRGDSTHMLWFEAFDEHFAFNLCLKARAEIADDDAMLDIMRSFDVDSQIESDLLQLRQTRLEDGSFVSVEHGLRLHLTDDWQEVEFEDLLLPGTAFILQKDEGRCMIQLLSTHPAEADDTEELLYELLEEQGLDDYAEEASSLTLSLLNGVEAQIVEVDDGPVHRLNVAFVYEGYGYFGLFMWVAPDAEEARPFMLNALMNLEPAA